MSVVAEHAVTVWRRAKHLLGDRAALTATIRAYGDALGAPSRAVATALAFKAYAYDVIEPVVLGWTTRRRVLDLSAGNTLILPTAGGYRVRPARQLLTVLPDDPLAGTPGVTVAPDEPALLSALRSTLVDAHLAPAVEAFRAVRGGGARPLWGSAAQSLCYPVTIAGVPHPFDDVAALLGTLDPETAALVEVAEVTDARATRPVLLRRTCCYAYALPAGALCSTCCLLGEDARQKMFADRGERLRRRPVPLAVPPAGRSHSR